MAAAQEDLPSGSALARVRVLRGVIHICVRGRDLPDLGRNSIVTLGP